jgi:hypothetical protein
MLANEIGSPFTEGHPFFLGHFSDEDADAETTKGMYLSSQSSMLAKANTRLRKKA